MKILLVGGGSGGPVAPLLAVADEIKTKHPRAEFLLIGTKTGPEREMAEAKEIPFWYISAGKWRRYFAFKNLFSPFLIIAGFFQAKKIISSFQPDAVFATGSFVQVPVVWAAWLKKIPVVLHQQDLVPSLANKLCQGCAKKITVSFEQSLSDFASSLGIFYKKRKSEKIVWTGNPFRESLKQGSKAEAHKIFNLRPDMPTLLVLGGGTGAQFINKLLVDSAPKLTKSMQIIHSTGRHKNASFKWENYHAFEFIDNMADAYAAADLVVARAGLSTLTELSNLKKVAIIIPLPGTHQEINAMYLLKREAAVVIEQQDVTPTNFTNFLRKLLFHHEGQKAVKENIAKIMPHNATEKIAEIVIKAAQSN